MVPDVAMPMPVAWAVRAAGSAQSGGEILGLSEPGQGVTAFP